MKPLSLLLLLAFATGCGAAADPYTVTAEESRARPVHRALQVYLDEFVRAYGVGMTEIPIAIGPLEKGVAGKCYVPGDKTPSDAVADTVFGESTQPRRRIVINQDYFAKHKDNYDAMQNVMFHELGHCILQRGHTSATMEDKDFGEIPRSIMYPSSFGDKEFYRPNFPHYKAELFGRKLTEERPALKSQTVEEAFGTCLGFDGIKGF